MSCDSYYGIGHKHQVCQDYALHGSLGDMEYVIVADGCSSAEHSEIGAQILCHAAKYQVALSYQSGLFLECSLETLSRVLGNSILKRIHEIRESYPIGRKALEATLFIAVDTPKKTFVFGWGDGVFIERYRFSDGAGTQCVCDIDFTGNAPFYLVSDLNRYLKDLRNKGHEEPLTTYTYHYKNTTIEGEVNVSSVKREELTDGKPLIWCNDKSKKDIGDLYSITVCTDGIKSFQENEKKDSVDLNLIVPEVVEYKATEGEFVKKRMFFFERMARKNNWSHYDDIGCGTLLI